MRKSKKARVIRALDLAMRASLFCSVAAILMYFLALLFSSHATAEILRIAPRQLLCLNEFCLEHTYFQAPIILGVSLWVLLLAISLAIDWRR
jgi:hypothetical protein